MSEQSAVARPRQRLTVATSLTLACWLGIPSLAAAQRPTTAMKLEEGKVQGFSPKSPEKYWTPKRLSEAKPLPFYNDDVDLAKGTGPEVPPVVGPPTLVPGGRPTRPQPSPPSGSADIAASVATVGETSLLGTQNVGDNTFLNRDATLWLSYPWITIGKLLLTSPDGANRSCSAAVISGNSIIVTAAHCCFDRGEGAFIRGATFLPAMRNGTAPFGMFGATSARVLNAWITGGGRANDVCLLRLNPNSSGQTVSSLVGFLGRSSNHDAVQHHFAFGYPGNLEAARFKYECSAESYANCGDGNVLAMGCNMTRGASGGPWIRVFKKFEGGSMNFVNGVVSGFDDCTGTMGQSLNAPRFTSNNIVPLCTAEGC